MRCGWHTTCLMMKTLTEWGRALADVLMPRLCPVCGKALVADERYICRGCLAALPRTHLEEVDFNAMEQLFAGKVPVERATGYFYYQKSSPYAQILFDIKYRNRPQMGRWLTARAAGDLRTSGFFDGIEVIVPVPLHPSKLAQRGYNQSDYLAQGLAQVLKLPIIQALKSTRAHGSQTRRGATDRWLNAQNTYTLRTSHSQQLAGKHILLVDDVVTTGATLEACAHALLAIPGTRISLFTLATARLD